MPYPTTAEPRVIVPNRPPVVRRELCPACDKPVHPLTATCGCNDR